MGADQLPLPHLGPQARVLLDRIVASGNTGVERRDADDWLLSRLIELRYVEENPLNTSAVVCTSAGRHRWQIEMLADEQRAASAMRRQLIRYRVDERLSNFEARQSTALTIAYPPMTPQLYGGVPQPSPPRALKTRLKPALATLFAAAAAGLVVALGDTEPQDMHAWLSPPPPRAVAALPATPIVAAPVAAHVEAAVAIVQPPLPVVTRVPASVGTIARAEQIATVIGHTLAKVEDAVPGTSAIADAVTHYDAAIRNAFMTTAALADATMSNARQWAGDLVAGARDSVRPIAAAVVQAASATEAPVPGVPAPVATAPAAEPPPIAIAMAPAAPPGRTPTKAPAARASDDDTQHVIVERLNALSLAAARRGEAWRPNGPRDVAQTERPPWR